MNIENNGINYNIFALWLFKKIDLTSAYSRRNVNIIRYFMCIYKITLKI